MQLNIHTHDCLTLGSTEKNVHYLRLTQPDNAAEPLDYEPGDWITVQAQNQTTMVEAILAKLGLKGQETIELRRIGQLSSFDALQHHLEITVLNPAILNKLQRQLNLGSWSDRQAMMDFAKGKDMLDLLDYFDEFKQLGLKALAFFSPLAPRYYSIASANIDGKSLAILYRQVQYKNNNRERFGVASNYLANADTTCYLEVEIKHNPTFKMPANTLTPMIMIGSGTGMAPFIGFMQQREHNLKQRQEQGAAIMFYGEIDRHHCLFSYEFERWHKQGLIEHFYALSREQADKIYVQHRMAEHAQRIWQLLEQGAHIYICGSQDKLAVDVKLQLLLIFQQQGALSAEGANALWDELRKQKRLQHDVY